MANSAVELMDQGMQVLVDQLGHVQAEKFISIIIRERFDYTKWHRDLFEGMSLHELNEQAAEYSANNPW